MESTIVRLDTWLRDNRGEYYQRLVPGLADDALRRLETDLGLTLPDGLRDLLRWRNGQASGHYESFVHNYSLMGATSIVAARRTLNELLEGGDFDLANWWDPAWIPFLENGGGDHDCIDLRGSFGGTPGQVLRFWHDDASRDILHRSFDAWLEGVVTALEADDYAIDEYGVEIDDEGPGYPLQHEAG